MSSSSVTVIPDYRGTVPRISPLRGAMIQTGAMFVDAYRELNARKMFWVVLIISGVIVLSFAGVGIDEKGLTIFGISLPIPFNTSMMPRADFYKLMFNKFGVDIWLSWFATILALISTAGIFPDLLTGGSIDLYLSKPLSRLRLFLTKFSSALLFVTLQVGVFTLACFLVLGLRGGTWLWGLFLTIPIMVCFFSYLYSICVLLAMITRSTLAALLLTLLCWFGIYIIHATESTLLFFQIHSQQEMVQYDRDINTLQKKISRLESPTTAPVSEPATDKNEGWIARYLGVLATQQEKKIGREATLAQTKIQLADTEKKKAEFSNPFVYWHNLSMILMSVLPKTSETIEVLNRGLTRYAKMDRAVSSDDDDQPPALASGSSSGSSSGGHRRFDQTPEQAAVEERSGRELINVIHNRSIAWVIGTSLGFELVVLGAAALIFVRRDF